MTPPLLPYNERVAFYSSMSLIKSRVKLFRKENGARIEMELNPRKLEKQKKSFTL